MATHGFNNGRLKLHNTSTNWWVGYNDDTRSFFDYYGSGSPEGVLSADKSSIYRDYDNGDIYTKTTDTVNTGWILVGNAKGTNIYFVGKWGNDSNDGLSFESAKLTVQSAVTAAPANSTILVYPGTYTETVTHVANNVTMIAQGKPNSVIITQADSNVIDFSSYTGIQYKFFGISCTAATTAINTIQGSTGNCTFKECHLSMISSTNIVAVVQPAVGAITDAGKITMRIGQVTYAHTGACGGTAQKGAFTVADGGVIELGLIKNLNITNSGTALVSSVCLDTSSTGYFDVYENAISITDPNATLVVGLGYLGGTGIEHEFRRNNIHITATANAGYGIFCADTASTTRSFYNHIHVVDTAGSSYGFYVGAGSTLTSQFDDIIADNGNNIVGTFLQVNSEVDGDFTATNNVFASTFDTNVAAAAVTLSGTTLAADGTDANIPVTITPKGTEAVTIDGLDYPMADGTAGQAVVTNGSGVLSFSSAIAGGGLNWTVVTDATQALAINQGYVGNRGTAITYTLPATCAVGSIIKITNIGAGLPVIAQNAGQSINYISNTTTVGVAGSLTGIQQFASIELLCVVANTTFNVIGDEGSFTVV